VAAASPADDDARPRRGYDAAVPIDDDALGELLDELEIGLELNSAGPAIEPLLDALIAAAPPAALQRAGGDAAEALWDAHLARDVRAELLAFRDDAVRDHARLVPTIDNALAELERPARNNQVAHALVWRAATKLLRRANRNHERIAELEHALEHTSTAWERRRLTLPIASTASLCADFGDEEAAKAVAAYAFSMSTSRRRSRRQGDRAAADLASALATDERRRVVRSALAELAQLSADEFPVASLVLRELLAEPIPADPAEDEIWVSLVVGMAHEQLEDALTDTSARRR